VTLCSYRGTNFLTAARISRPIARKARRGRSKLMIQRDTKCMCYAKDSHAQMGEWTDAAVPSFRSRALSCSRARCLFAGRTLPCRFNGKRERRVHAEARRRRREEREKEKSVPHMRRVDRTSEGESKSLLWWKKNRRMMHDINSGRWGGSRRLRIDSSQRAASTQLGYALRGEDGR
jgi:hypothetical protein